MLLGFFMSASHGSIVWHWVQDCAVLWNPTTFPESIVIRGRTKSPTRSVHLAAVVTRHSGFRTRTKSRMTAEASPRRIPAPDSQRMTFSVLPEKKPSPFTLLASVGVVAVVVELELDHFMGVFPDLLGEVERLESRALLGMTALAGLLVGMDGTQLDEIGPLILLVFLLE